MLTAAKRCQLGIPRQKLFIEVDGIKRPFVCHIAQHRKRRIGQININLAIDEPRAVQNRRNRCGQNVVLALLGGLAGNRLHQNKQHHGKPRSPRQKQDDQSPAD